MGNEETYQIIVVVVLLGTSLIQGVIHLLTWVALGDQDPDDQLATRMSQRELSLALKLFTRALFELILVMLVFNDALPFTMRSRAAVYLTTSIFAIYAVWRGVSFILALKNENWGRPRETKDARDARQEHQQELLDETTMINAEASLVNAERGNHLSAEFGKLESERRDMRQEHSDALSDTLRYDTRSRDT